MTVRALETLIRLSTAHAKARLSPDVLEIDALAAESILRYALYKEVIKAPKKGDKVGKRRKLSGKKKNKPKRDKGSDEESSSEEEDDDSSDDEEGGDEGAGKERMEMPGARREGLARGAKKSNGAGNMAEHEEEEEEEAEDEDEDQDAMDAMDELGRELTPVVPANEQARQVEAAKTPEPSTGLDPPRYASFFPPPSFWSCH